MKTTGENKFLLKQVEEKIKRAVEQCIPETSRFLGTHQLSEVLVQLKHAADQQCSIISWGGFDDAERKVIVAVPFYTSLEDVAPLKVVRVSCEGREKLEHGQYLGSVLGLGINRNLVGDILVGEDSADIIVLTEIAEYVAENLIRVGSAKVSCQVMDIGHLNLVEAGGKLINTTVASLRLDVIASAAFGVSRSKAAEAVKAGALFVDDIQRQTPDFNVGVGQKITWRKRGRAVLTDIVGTTKKQRIAVELMIQRRK